MAEQSAYAPEEEVDERAKTPEGKLAYFLGAMESADTANFDFEGVQPTSEHPEAKPFIENDGKRTYLVHSTVESVAKDILQNGFLVRTNPAGIDNNPQLYTTTFLLEGPNGTRPQEATNRALIDYHHHKGQGDDPDRVGDCKIIIELPFSRPTEEQHNLDRHAHSYSPYLSEYGKYVKRLPDGSAWISPQYVKGYFDQNAFKFVKNRNFTEVPEDQLENGDAHEIPKPHLISHLGQTAQKLWHKYRYKGKHQS